MNASLSATAERRRGDRRSRPTSIFRTFRFRGRRRSFRRSGEGAGAYLDRPFPEVLAMTCFLLVASALDAFFTLEHLSTGSAVEANPVMRMALQWGVGAFVALKMSVTAVAAVFLSTHQSFPMGLKGLRYLCLVYALLLVYHVLLLGCW